MVGVWQLKGFCLGLYPFPLSSMWQIIWLGEPLPTTVFNSQLMHEIYLCKNDWEQVEATCAGILDGLNQLDEFPRHGSVNLKDQGWERIYEVIWRCPYKKGFFLQHRQSNEVALAIPLANTLLNVACNGAKRWLAKLRSQLVPWMDVCWSWWMRATRHMVGWEEVLLLHLATEW